jgi:hypothetical protein
MIQIQDFVLESPGAGGANERLSGSLIDDNQSARPDASNLPLLNVNTNDVGEILQRNGYTVYSGQLTTSSYISGMYQYRKFNGNEFELVCADNGSVKHIWDISTPGSPSDIIGASTFTSDTLFSFTVVADKLIMTTDANDTPLYWDGTGNVTSLAGSPPTGKYCAEFNNYGFLANTTANPERVYWSNLYDPTTWTGTDFYRMNDAVTGLGRSQDNLFIFTRRGVAVSKYTGDSLTPFTFDILDTNIGCLAPHSIVNANQTIYWVGNDNHIYKMNGYIPERVSELIPTTIGEINSAAIGKCVSVEHRELRQIWFFYPKDSGTTNNFVVAYDYINQQFFFYDNMDANYAANFQASTGALQTYFGDRTGRIYLTNIGNTDYLEGVSTAINAFKYTKQFNLGMPGKAKRLRKARATVNAQGSCLSSIDVIGDFGQSGGETLSLNHATNTTTIGAFIIGTSILGGSTSTKADNDCATTARYIQFKIYHNQNSIPYSMKDLSLQFQAYQGGNR